MIITNFIALLYFRTTLLSWLRGIAYGGSLQRLLLDQKRIEQLAFSDIDKGYSEHINTDVWFDMVEYISKPTDGVRSYHEKYRWLENFILPLDLDRPREVLEDFHDARVAFELAPTEFTEHIERFSELLKTRDLCRLLIKYLGDGSKDEQYSKVHLWTQLQADIIYILRPSENRDNHISMQGCDLEATNRVGLSLRHFQDSGPEDYDSSAAGLLQEFLKRLTRDEESQKTEKSKPNPPILFKKIPKFVLC